MNTTILHTCGHTETHATYPGNERRAQAWGKKPCTACRIKAQAEASEAAGMIPLKDLARVVEEADSFRLAILHLCEGIAAGDRSDACGVVGAISEIYARGECLNGPYSEAMIAEVVEGVAAVASDVRLQNDLGFWVSARSQSAGMPLDHHQWIGRRIVDQNLATTIRADIYGRIEV